MSPAPGGNESFSRVRGFPFGEIGRLGPEETSGRAWGIWHPACRAGFLRLVSHGRDDVERRRPRIEILIQRKPDGSAVTPGQERQNKGHHDERSEERSPGPSGGEARRQQQGAGGQGHGVADINGADEKPFLPLEGHGAARALRGHVEPRREHTAVPAHGAAEPQRREGKGGQGRPPSGGCVISCHGSVY